MEVFGMAALFGLILGFMFGIGCAAAVIYTIYMGGYRNGMEDSLRPDKSARYSANIAKVQGKLDEDTLKTAKL